MTPHPWDDWFDAELESADPPRGLAELLARLPESARHEPEARRRLAELWWLHAAAERAFGTAPSAGFADRVAARAQPTVGLPPMAWKVGVGFALAASLAGAILVARPEFLFGRPQRPNAEGIAQAPMAATPLPALPLPAVKPGWAEGLVLQPRLPKPTTELAMAVDWQAAAAPLAAPPRAAAQRVQPVARSVAKAFAFLGELPAAMEKRPL